MPPKGTLADPSENEFTYVKRFFEANGSQKDCCEQHIGCFSTGEFCVFVTTCAET